MRYAVGMSTDYGPLRVVVRDHTSTPPGRVLCVIERDNEFEAEQIAQMICDLLNEKESNESN